MQRFLTDKLAGSKMELGNIGVTDLDELLERSLKLFLAPKGVQAASKCELAAIFIKKHIRICFSTTRPSFRIMIIIGSSSLYSQSKPLLSPLFSSS